MWAHSIREGTRAANAPRQLSGRGVSYWTDGRGDDRVLYVTTGYRLVALNAKTGAAGRVVRQERRRRPESRRRCTATGQPIDLETGEIGLHSTPTVVKDVVIVGSSFKEGMTVVDAQQHQGARRARSTSRTGKLLWTFNTIPRPGEFGNDTWENDSWAINGNTGVWTQITVDEEARPRLPAGRDRRRRTTTAAIAPATTCSARAWSRVDLKTGQRKWHFQFVHHPIWDHDMSSAPILLDITIDGKAAQAGRAAEQAGFLYVFDRVTGQPIWPIEERPVPQTRRARRKDRRRRSRIPTKPPAYARQFLQGAGRS